MVYLARLLVRRRALMKSEHYSGIAISVGVGYGIFYTLRRSFSSPPPSSLNFKAISEKRSIAKPKKSILYTRTGDSGSSSLYNGERCSKADVTFHALGTTDELNAAIGVAREYCMISKNGLEELLLEIQSRLFDVGASIATPRDTSNTTKLNKTPFPAICTTEIEYATDELDSKLPRITTFILPSGGLAASHLHMARVICRRAERSVIPLLEAGKVDPEIGRFLNRLSDFLFAAARYACQMEGLKETSWTKMRETH